MPGKDRCAGVPSKWLTKARRMGKSHRGRDEGDVAEVHTHLQHPDPSAGFSGRRNPTRLAHGVRWTCQTMGIPEQPWPMGDAGWLSQPPCPLGGTTRMFTVPSSSPAGVRLSGSPRMTSVMHLYWLLPSPLFFTPFPASGDTFAD